jgi:hypothetical protein
MSSKPRGRSEMDAAMRMATCPQATKPVAHLPGDSTHTYLQKCKQNIEAEVWAMVATGSRQAVRVVAKDDSIVSVSNAGVVIPLEQLQFCLLILNGLLCLVTRLRSSGKMGYHEEGVRVLSGGSFLIGYVRPYLMEYVAVMRFIESGGPPILDDIVSLDNRTVFAFDQRPLCDAVACNALQRQSVVGLRHTVEGIQGPPGTGKSSTIFHIVHSAMPLGMDAMLTCVQNRAVDALASKFQQSGTVPFVVLGNPERLGDTAKQYTLESLVAREQAVIACRGDSDWSSRVLDYLDGRLQRRIASRQFKSTGWRLWWVAYAGWVLKGDIATWSQLKREALEQLKAAIAEAEDRISSSTTVFMCTVDTLSRVKQSKRRRLLIIDEAGTVPEYKIPLAVSLGVDAVIAVGDQKQLQPFSHTKMSHGFFHRLAEAIVPPMLEEQYRMHHGICSLVSSSFYGGRLVTNPLVIDVRAAVSLSGVHWVDYPDVNAETSGRNGATCNNVELALLRTFMQGVEDNLLVKGKSVLIIAFYREQFQLLMRQAESMGFVGTRMVNEEGAKPEKYFINPLFRIATVDASQGSESDVVVLSCVRCNVRKQVGFLSHPNRLCVALSRARERLVVLGSARTLTARIPVFKALFRLANVRHSFDFKETKPALDNWEELWEAMQ